ncbi:MAG: hypothetical protein J1E41_03045 [Ruminococcus sp.]|nr:hypothetical protein [Ruminococcus sp.]
MAYYNGRGYRPHNSKKFHLSRRLKNRIIIVASGILIFALIIVLISTVFSCICSIQAPTEPTIDTATVGSTVKAEETTKTTKSDKIKFKEPDIEDDGDSVGEFDNEYYIWNNKAFEAFTGTDKDAENYAKYINNAKSTLGSSVNVYSLVMPTHIEMGLPNRLKNNNDGIKTSSQADYIKSTYNSLSKKVKYVNAYNLLSEHCKDYIYFDSDHNPTALGGYYAYQAFVELLGKKAIPLNECTEGSVESFMGSYNNFTDSELNVDTVQYWDFPYSVSNDVTDTDGNTNTLGSCYYKSVAEGSNAYSVFLFGRNPLEVIKSESKKASGKIAIVHDSIGSSMVPYFTYNYKEVYSIDYREYSGNLKNLCKENGIKNVLFINDTSGTVNSEKLELMQNILS